MLLKLRSDKINAVSNKGIINITGADLTSKNIIQALIIAIHP